MTISLSRRCIAVLALLLAAGSSATAQNGEAPMPPEASPGVEGGLPDARSAVEAATPDESEIRTALEFEGYSNIRNMREDGGHYVAEAERFGETVTVRVDGATRLIVAPQELSQTQIRNKLEWEGYANIRGLDRPGDVGIYNVEAEKDGRTVALRIDPMTGNVMLETAPEN